MPAFKDLTGLRFGRLVVEYQCPEKKNNKIVWHCKCDCGNERDIMGSQLTKSASPTRSCGCLQKENTRLANQSEDLSGKKYGRLTVLYRIPDSSMWKCECECGNYIEVSTNHLNSGHTQSCGCLQKDRTSETSSLNLVGEKYGLLTVLSLDVEKSVPKHRYYKCKCECGNIISVSTNNLRNGNTQTCGCGLMSHGEIKIKNLLTEYNIPFEREKTFDTCINPETGKKLRFDFYVDNKYLIEYDGEQHFNPRGFMEQDKSLTQRDKIKNKWCEENHIPLIRIPYTKYSTLSIDDLLLTN